MTGVNSFFLMRHHQLDMSQTKLFNQVYVFFSFSEGLALLYGFVTDLICLLFLEGRGFALLLNPRSSDRDGRSFLEIFF